MTSRRKSGSAAARLAIAAFAFTLSGAAMAADYYGPGPQPGPSVGPDYPPRRRNPTHSRNPIRRLPSSSSRSATPISGAANAIAGTMTPGTAPAGTGAAPPGDRATAGAGPMAGIAGSGTAGGDGAAGAALGVRAPAALGAADRAGAADTAAAGMAAAGANASLKLKEKPGRAPGFLRAARREKLKKARAAAFA